MGMIGSVRYGWLAGVVTISAIAGRQSVGNLKDVTVRYRWLGAWGTQPRFKRLP